MSLALLPNSNSLRILIICDSVNFDLFMTVNLIIYYIFKLSEKWGSLPTFFLYFFLKYTKSKIVNNKKDNNNKFIIKSTILLNGGTKIETQINIANNNK